MYIYDWAHCRHNVRQPTASYYAAANIVADFGDTKTNDPVYSAAKSFPSAIASIAFAKGLIRSADDRVDLRGHHRDRGEDRRLFGADYHQHGLIFCQPDGRYYSPDRVGPGLSREA